MTQSNNELYVELKDDVFAVADPLFELSARLLQDMGNFLPHGYALTNEGQDKMIGAHSDSLDGMSTSDEILPLLHEGLRATVLEGNVRAIGVAENVKIQREDETWTDAMKVLLEHERGLCVALYRPFKIEGPGNLVVGDTFAVAASPEIQPGWTNGSE